MEKRQIFYSFHYANDVMRVQQIGNIGMLEDNSPVSPNEWEKIKRSGDREIESCGRQCGQGWYARRL